MNTFSALFVTVRSRDGSLGIALDYGLGDRGSGTIPGGGWEYLSLPPRPDWLRGPTQAPIQWVPGAVSLAVKRPGREADHSPPSSADVKNAWSYNSTPPVRLHDNFTFLSLPLLMAVLCSSDLLYILCLIP
jgi:hypothetical protein